ncbi:MAG: ABC transporter ATP-binding protein [Burkholderiaceae bacterium]|nr:MAG: ABC transporter ATP-binding protein [Burkholderiaceae bacterium]
MQLAAKTDSTQPDEFVSVNQIHKDFGTGQSKRNVLSNISFSIKRGSFVSLLGVSGCGKSTLLQIIAGLLKPDGGQVALDRMPVNAPPFRMLYLFQQYTKSIFPWRSVTGNIAFGMESRKKWSRHEIAERCSELIKLVGLDGFGDYYPRQLSGGMQQRVAIARALACEPDVLLMDEPFSAVDAMTRSSLQDLVLKLWSSLGLTIVFVTHDIAEAIYLSDRVIVLHRSPSGVALDMYIDLPYPRNQLVTLDLPDFLKYRHRLYKEIYSEESTK